jgi:hypothetical protein
MKRGKLQRQRAAVWLMLKRGQLLQSLSQHWEADMQELPVLNVTQGAPITDEFTLQGVNLTGWTGAVRFIRRYNDVTYAWDFNDLTQDQRVIASVVPVLTVTAGNTRVSTAVADTSMFPALPRIGDFVTAFAEYRLTSPTGAVLVYQRPVSVAGAL